MFSSGRIRVVVLCLADIVGVGVLWGIAVFGYWLLGGNYSPGLYLRFWPVPFCYLSLNAALGLYHGNVMYPSAPLSPVEELRRLFDSAFLTHIGVIAFLGFAYQTTDGYSRLVIAVSGMLTAVLAQPIRMVVRRMLRELDLAQIPVVIVGSGVAADKVVRELARDDYIGFRPVGYFDREGRALCGLRRLGELRDVVCVACELGVRTLVACEDERIFRSQLREYTKWFTHIEYLPSAAMFPVFGSKTISIGGVGGIEMVNQGRMHLLRAEKWLLDKTLALVAFILLTPLFVVLPILIKLTSRGPVFYRQERIGKNGCKICVWKFRSMYEDADSRLAKILSTNPKLAAEWQTTHKLVKDPRVTPFGRFLRKTSLDELPQFFNVFNGSMALVGPRPIVKEEVGLYGDSYAIFSSVKPGITGLWQVSGRSETDYVRRVALDAQYVLNWSPWLDIWILFRTVGAVLLLRGAC